MALFLIVLTYLEWSCFLNNGSESCESPSPEDWARDELPVVSVEAEAARSDLSGGSPAVSPPVFSSFFPADSGIFGARRPLPPDEEVASAVLRVLGLLADRVTFPPKGHNAHPEIHVQSNRVAKTQRAFRRDRVEIWTMRCTSVLDENIRRSWSTG